tara:strand:- start:1809 stop:2048 length:240 start_codon:yes stop_codon:yes gene_type:complete
MENKYIVIAAIIGFIGTFFEPSSKYEIKERDYKIENKAEICIDSLRNVNDSLINVLQIENRILKDMNQKLRNKKNKRRK